LNDQQNEIEKNQLIAEKIFTEMKNEQNKLIIEIKNNENLLNLQKDEILNNNKEISSQQQTLQVINDNILDKKQTNGN